MIMVISLMTFVFFRTKGIARLNNEIINLVIDYSKRHTDYKGLPTIEELFVPISKKIFSFKKLTLENWVSAESIKKLKS